MLPQGVVDLLNQYQFVTLATSTLVGRPNAAPKFLLDIQGDAIYLVDYVVNKIFQNIEMNPYVAISIIDDKTLTGYELLGKANVLTEGLDYEAMVDLLRKRITSMSVDRIVNAIRTGVKSENAQFSMAEKVAIFKVKVTEIVIINAAGGLKRERVSQARIHHERPRGEREVPTNVMPLLTPESLEAKPAIDGDIDSDGALAPMRKKPDHGTTKE